MINSPQESTETQVLEPLWTIQQTAKFLSLGHTTIRKWIRDGKIKSVKISNRVRIPRSEVERLVSETRNKMQE